MSSGGKMKKNYTIAICDILGFTDFVQNNPLDDVVESSLDWFRKALHHSIHKNKFPSHIPSLAQLQNQSELGIALFSDTILIYTLEDTEKCLQSLISSIGWLLFETMLTENTRLRCGISYGEAYIDEDNSIFVGKPIIEACQLEKKQAWSGGALTTSAVQRIPKDAGSGKYTDWWVVPYLVPITNYSPLDTLALNWTIGIHDKDSFKFPWSNSYDTPTPGDWKKIPAVCEKWKNTKTFHDKVCQDCKQI